MPTSASKPPPASKPARIIKTKTTNTSPSPPTSPKASTPSKSPATATPTAPTSATPPRPHRRLARKRIPRRHGRTRRLEQRLPLLLLAPSPSSHHPHRPAHHATRAPPLQSLDTRPSADLTPLPEAGQPHEIRGFIRAINHLLARTEAAMQQQQRFIADAAHELRSPMTALSCKPNASPPSPCPSPPPASSPPSCKASAATAICLSSSSPSPAPKPPKPSAPKPASAAKPSSAA